MLLTFALLAALGQDVLPNDLLGGLDPERTLALRVGKVLTIDSSDRVLAPGMIVIEDGKLRYVGPPVELPDGIEARELPKAWAAPGLVDLHTHIHSGGFGDINDMVQAVNPELRATPAFIPGNPLIRMGCAAGVTTLFGIPGSGTNMGGFGLLYKSKVDPTYDEAILRDPGGLKVAQDSNPQRRNRVDFGVSRAGQNWNLEDVNDRAVAALSQERFDPALENLKRVHKKELPVLIHCAGSEGVVNTARMWRWKYGARCTISHGSFDGWKSAPVLAEWGMPVNHGPRTIDYVSSREGRIIGTSAEFVAAGVPLFSLNTDSSVIPQEELFLQGSMSARYGADSYTMLRALTIHPAIVFGIDDRVGSLEAGKDADVVLWNGDPLDPRSAVELVMIDGVIEYDRERDGQVF